ncbi:MAG: hypothetical protein NTW78_10310 [Campylobacterales bacterium]|nr:hypothetical protein [Campylobacterales bacterium]
MIKLFLNKTDEFLCKNVRSIFEKTEDSYKNRGLNVNLIKELHNLEFNPIVCSVGESSNFEKNIKIKIKAVLGMFFVAIPLFAFSLVTYILNIDYAYAFIFTFVVAILVSSRMDDIAKRYAQRRFLLVRS